MKIDLHCHTKSIKKVMGLAAMSPYRYFSKK